MKRLFSLMLCLIYCSIFNNVIGQNQDAIIANVGNDFYTQIFLDAQPGLITDMPYWSVGDYPAWADVSIVSDIGIFNMIFYYFYDMVERTFSFVNNIFLLLFITIVICSVLICCPIIGAYYELYLFNKNIVDAFITFLDEFGFSLLNDLWEFKKSLGPEITNIFIQIFDETFYYFTDSSANLERIVKRIGIIPSAIIACIIFSIIIFIIFIIYFIYRYNFIQKFIINNTVSLKQKILNKNKKKKK